MSKLRTINPESENTRAKAVSSIGVSMYVFFPSGGISRYSNKLAEAMQARGDIEVEVVCSPEYSWKDSKGYSTWPGLRPLSHKISVLRRLKFLRGQFENPRRCINRAASNGSSIIHFSNINQVSFPYWKRKLAASGLKCAISVHDVKRRKGILNKRWEKKQLQGIYRFADVLFVHSAYQLNELVSFAGVNPAKVFIVPHGPYEHDEPTEDPSSVRKRLGIAPDRQVALFFGQVRDDKNLDSFMRSMAESQESFHLVVAGKAGGRHRNISYYISLAQELGLEDQITFNSGYIPDQEVSNLFVASDWVVLPYKNSFTSQSGVLNVAAHYRKPVLASSAPVLAETVRENVIGIACEGDNVSALKDGIERIYRQVDTGVQYDFEGYLHRNSWEVNARICLKAYKQITG